MKRTVLTVLLLCGGLLFGLRGNAEARVSIGVSVGFFYDSLSPYGSWIDSPRHGYVWAPRHVGRGWRPYLYGRWVYTDYGWTWVSSERWAWATYHYGRWYHDPYDGWLWVPGDEWAPAWVEWRWGDDYVGWAPLPPGGDPFQAYDYGLDPFAYSFVRVGSFFDPGLSRRVLPVSRNRLLLHETRPVGGYARVGSQVVDRGIEPERLSRSVGYAVPRASLREVQSIDQAREFRSGVLPVFRPRVEASRRVDPAGGGRVVAERPEDLARRQELPRRDSALGRGQAPPAATAPPAVGDRERALRDAEARAQLERQQQDAVRRQERAQRERERLDGQAARRQDANRQRELTRRQTQQDYARQEQAARRQQQQADVEQQRAARRQQQAEHEQQIRQRQAEHEQQGRQQQIEREQRARQQQQADAEQQRAARRQQQAERDQQARQQQAERERQAASARERGAGQRPPQVPAQPPPAKNKHGDKDKKDGR